MKRPVILFADNSKKFVEGRKEILEKAGYRVIIADNPSDARRMLQGGGIDLALVDIRLEDDNDPDDRSGLDLVRTVSSDVPKIILTWYPTWQAVRDAFGADVDDISPVVDFIHKDEVNRMLLAVNWTLKQSRLKENLFRSFQARSMMALQENWGRLDQNDATQRLQASLEKTTREITEYREQANQRARQYHQWGLAAGVVTMGMILLSVILALAGSVSSALPSMFAGVLTQAASSLLHQREEAAHQRVAKFFEQLEQANQLQNLLSMCDTLVDVRERDHYKGMIITSIAEKWFGPIAVHA